MSTSTSTSTTTVEPTDATEPGVWDGFIRTHAAVVREIEADLVAQLMTAGLAYAIAAAVADFRRAGLALLHGVEASASALEVGDDCVCAYLFTRAQREADVLYSNAAHVAERLQRAEEEKWRIFADHELKARRAREQARLEQQSEATT